MRSMELKTRGHTVYHSTFDELTGTLARVVDMGSRTRRDWATPWENDRVFEERYRGRHWIPLAFSPVPETVDISITDKCNFGCPYCYQDSRPRKDHADKTLVERTILGFDEPPYQVAIGGGEPTLHPDFDYILRKARDLGTVPNFTTAGDESLTDDIIKTANEVCGGIAMTYHAFKGIDWFVDRYRRLRDKLKIQLNVHLIVDKDAAKNLNALVDRFEDLGRVRLVLLAYYPDVGRASLDSLITKRVYQKDFPTALANARSVNFQVAFSEGLLPYFNSRPELKIDTSFAMPSEGLFSCYFDPRGRIAASSFEAKRFESREDTETVFNNRSQKLWDHLGVRSSPASGDACYRCPHEPRCATPHDFHYLMCNLAPHNRTPLKPEKVEPPAPKSIYAHLRERKF